MAQEEMKKDLKTAKKEDEEKAEKPLTFDVDENVLNSEWLQVVIAKRRKAQRA